MNWTLRDKLQRYLEKNVFFLLFVAILFKPQNECGSQLKVRRGAEHRWAVIIYTLLLPISKVHGANMGPIWGRQDPGGPHVGPMNFAISAVHFFITQSRVWTRVFLSCKFSTFHISATPNTFINISMAQCKKDITPLHQQWSYLFLALTHRYHLLINVSNGNYMSLTCINSSTHLIPYAVDKFC